MGIGSVGSRASRAFRGVTFDGGGICGLYSIVIFDRLVQARPQLLDRIDLFAGTSTGGIISLALAAGIPIPTIIDLYRTRAKEIFQRPWHRVLFSPCGLAESKYVGNGLVKVMYDVLGAKTLGDLNRKVTVPAFNLKEEASPDDPSWRVRFFHNFTAEDAAEKIADVAIRTASAPTYFPAYQGYIDGGVACNHPAVLAIGQGVRFAGGGGEMGEKRGADLADICILSIGTGGQIKYIDGSNLSWGAAKWAKPIIEVFMGGQSLVADSLAAKLLGDRYHRLCPIIPDIALDDLSKINQLLELGRKADLTAALEFLDDKFLAECPIYAA